jgi:hypothetical protein
MASLEGNQTVWGWKIGELGWNERGGGVPRTEAWKGDREKRRREATRGEEIRARVRDVLDEAVKLRQGRSDRRKEVTWVMLSVGGEMGEWVWVGGVGISCSGNL